jgi:DNA-directed RNA polymerase
MIRGLTFAAVHDSYWTHACELDQLSVLLRDEFVRLHSEPLLENLHESLQARFAQAKLPPIPLKGKLNLEEVKKSIYFFS